MAILSLLILACSGASFREKPITVWREVSRLVQIPVSSLPPKLRLVCDDTQRARAALIKIIAEGGVTYQTVAVTRAVIEHSRDAQFASEALNAFDKWARTYKPRTSAGRRADMLADSIRFAIWTMEKRGVFIGDEAWRAKRALSFGAMGRVLLSDLQSLEEAYLVLDYCHQQEQKVAYGRQFWSATVGKYGQTAELQALGAGLFWQDISRGIVTHPGKPDRVDESIEAHLEPFKVRECAIAAWRLAPNEPGIMSRVASGLCIIRDPLALQAAKAYWALPDMEDRRTMMLRGFDNTLGKGRIR